jgi:hypothetical protein
MVQITKATSKFNQQISDDHLLVFKDVHVVDHFSVSRSQFFRRQWPPSPLFPITSIDRKTRFFQA